MLTAVYVPMASSAFPDTYRALYEFVLAYAFAGTESLPAANIYRGWENRSALPAGSDEYAVITIRDTVRRGTSTDTFSNMNAPDDEPELYQLRTYYEVVAQIDVCSKTDAARERAYTLETAFRSLIGVDFFKKYDITAQWCRTVQEMVDVQGERQYVKRYMLELHLAYYAGVDVGSAWFNSVNLERVEDVDTHHKP